MNPSNNTLSSVYVNPYNQDSNTIQNSLGESESEAFGSIQQSLKKSRAIVRENSEKRGRGSSPESKAVMGSYL